MNIIDALTILNGEDNAATIYLKNNTHEFLYSASLSIESKNNDIAQLILITDILGRKTRETKNELLFYIYNDGTVKKRIIIE